MTAMRSEARRFRARLVCVDLDGTIADTAGEIMLAANAMLAQAGGTPLDRDTTAALVGQGARVFVERALTQSGLAANEANVDRWHAVFVGHYRAHNATLATLYPGVREGLQTMHAAGIKLACVTNKPRDMTIELLRRFEIDALFDAVVAGGDTAERKPHPQPILHACAAVNVGPPEAVMVGDSINDLAAGRAAGTRVFLVPYGYNEGRDVSELEPDAFVAGLDQVHGLLDVS